MDPSWENLFIKFGVAGLSKMGDIGLFPFLTLMFISLLSSLFISFLYMTFYSRRATGSHVHLSFPLLGISITAIFVTIQFSLPLSLGLLGALSIVRFRTPIKEPEEIGFIMLVVASSLSCATFNIRFLGVFLIITVLALLIMKFVGFRLMDRASSGMIIIAIPNDEYLEFSLQILTFLEETLPKVTLDSIAEGDDESVISYSFLKLDKDTLAYLQTGLRKITSKIKLNIFFNTTSQI